MSKHTPFFLITALTLSLSGSLYAAAPQLVSLTPSSGAGQSQTFTLTASDSDGASDISSMSLMVNSVFDGQTGCWLNWVNENQQAFFNTDGYNWAYLGPGANLENSRCSVQFVSANSSGNSVSVSFNVTFKSAMTGTQNVYAQAISKAAELTGYQQMATWTVPSIAAAPDFQVSITPNFQAMNPGYPVTFNVSVASLNGFAGNVLWSAAPLQPVTGLTLTPSGTSVYVPSGGSGSATILLSASDTAPHGNLYLQANFQSGSLQHTIPFSTQITPFKLPGNNPPGPVLSFDMSTRLTAAETFTITATHPSGYSAVTGINLLINSALDGKDACWLYYAPSGSNGGTLSLASDDESAWSTTPISAIWNRTNPILQNSQCSTSGGPVTVTGSGDTVTLTITLTMGPNFRGTRNVYLRASDQAGENTGYELMGNFGLPPATSSDFTVSVTPGMLSIASGSQGTMQLRMAGINGYAGAPSFTVAGLPPGSTLNSPGVVSASQPANFVITTASGTPIGSYPLTFTVTDGFLTHSANATLVVEAPGTPLLTMMPLSPAGATRTYVFAAHNLSNTPPDSLNVLVANSVDGRHACWLYFDRQLYLASDDGSSWLSGAPGAPLANSQCSVIWTDASNSAQLAVNATIVLEGQFAANRNIYMNATNSVGATGYQLEGIWTVQ